MSYVITRLVSTGKNCGLVSRNRPVSTGFYKGTLVSFLVLDVKRCGLSKSTSEVDEDMPENGTFST